MKFKPLYSIIIGSILILLLTSCGPWIFLKQGSTDQWISLTAGSTIGQTFVAEYDGLNAVQFMLAPQSMDNGTLTFHLRADPSADIDLGTARLPLREIQESRYYRFDFPPLAHSDRQYYYAYLEIEGKGSIDVGVGSPGTYQNGSAYQNQKPIDDQTTFNLVYDPKLAMIGFVLLALKWLVIIIAGFILLSVPGWALLSMIWNGWVELYWFEKLSLSVGFSLAFYVLLVLYTYLIHMQMGVLYVWLPLITGAGIICWRNRHWLLKKIHNPRNHPTKIENQAKTRSSLWPNISLVIIIILIFFTRFWAMRNLDAPMWGDSIQHTEIVQLMIDHRGLFGSWLPYAPYQSFSMHFGFPLAATLFAWMTGANSIKAVLVMGQILNTLAALAVYPLAVRLAKGDRWAGVVAVLIAGLLSPMPAYYINWGRYAQLAGQVILPISIWMLWDTLEGKTTSYDAHWWSKLPWVKIIISGMTLTGMVLCQFRMPYFYLAFLFAWLIGWALPNWRLSVQNWSRGLLSLILMGGTGLILFLPWGLRSLDTNLVNVVTAISGRSGLLEIVKQDYQAWQSVFFYIPPGLIVLTLVGLLWAIFRRDWTAASIGLWIAGMASISSLILLHVPGAQFVQSFAVLIVLYVPVGILVGYLFSYLVKWFLRWKQKGELYVVIVLTAVGLVAAWNQRSIAQPDSFAMVTRPDIRALAWIREKTPEEALFLVEGFSAIWKTNIVGADAGWWIPLIAQRENTMPPQYAITDEVPIEKGYSDMLVDLVAKLELARLNTKSGIRLLCDYGITHIYIGQEQGMVGNSGEPLFTPTELEGSSALNLIYHQDRVYIFSINEDACGK